MKQKQPIWALAIFLFYNQHSTTFSTIPMPITIEIEISIIKISLLAFSYCIVYGRNPTISAITNCWWKIKLLRNHKKE